MTGHVFLIRGDLRHLRCDAFLAVTDTAGNDGRSHWLEGHPSYDPTGANPLAGIQEGDVRLVLDAAPSSGAPAVYAGAIPLRGTTEPDVLARLLERFVTEAVRWQSRDSLRLLAIPLLGTGASADGSVNDKLVRRLLHDTHRLARDHHVDIVIVARGADRRGAALFSAALHVRRQLAATDASWWEPLEDPDHVLAKRLAQFAIDRQLVMFVGAGVSASAGLPDWNGLLAGLAGDAGLPEPLASAVSDRGRDPLDRAEALAHAVADKKRLGQLIGARIQEVSYPALQHVQLMDLPVTEVVTLNYDCLLEQASTDAGTALVVIPDRPRGAMRWVLKLHGTIEKPESLVLTRGDYLSYAAGRAALSGIVQALLITRHMLFIGFGMSDPHFHGILHEVRTALEQLQTQPDPPLASDSVDPLGQLGTALNVDDDPLQAELWGADVRTHRLVPDADERRGRRLEIFLDLVLSYALPLADHLLDPNLAGLRDADDERLVDALLPLTTALPALPANAATSQLRAALRRLGWTEPSRPQASDP